MNRRSLVNDSLKAGNWAVLLCALAGSACQATGDSPDSLPAVTSGSEAPASDPPPAPAAPACDRSKQFCGDTPPVAVDPTTIVVSAAAPHGQRMVKTQSVDELVQKHRDPSESVRGSDTARAASPEVLRAQALYLEKARELGQAYSGEELAKRKLELKRNLFPQSQPAVDGR